ncbi:MAG: MBL fold metallo-hydrolase [Patescibacteria group bacterium]|nr:MBL fold metallo-hydrolase [Patescibacteria group bacterium]
MTIITLPVGSLATNCYLVESKGEVGIIDPGDAGDFIIQKIEDLKSKPVWIAATHGHFDHVLAISEIALTYEIPFYLHPKDEFLLKRATESAEYFTGVQTDPVLVAPQPFPKSKKLRVGKLELEVIEIPGHTPGGVGFYCPKEKALFSGDLIFAGGGVGRTDFNYASEEELLYSINRILKLPPETVVYPGHGGNFTLDKLRFG